MTTSHVFLGYSKIRLVILILAVFFLFGCGDVSSNGDTSTTNSGEDTDTTEDTGVPNDDCKTENHKNDIDGDGIANPCDELYNAKVLVILI